MKNIQIIFFTIIIINIKLIASQKPNLKYYDILDLKPDASEAEIKRAFRRLSVKYHPDKNPGDPESHKKFIEVNKAYEVLTDKEKKQQYDMYGEEGLNQNFDVDAFGHKKTNKGPNAKADIRVTLEELYNGAIKDYTISKNVICKQCRGTGDKEGNLRVCKHCNGKGVRMQQVQVGIGFSMQMQVECDRCGGKGKQGGSNCPKCRGKRVIPETKTMKIQIEQGMQDNQEIVFKGESEQSPDYIPGDLVFTLKQDPHSVFKRAGDNLYTDLILTLEESIIGFRKQIKHLDSHYTEVAINGITQPNYVKIIKDEGMPQHGFPSSKGEMHVSMRVKLPKKINQQERELLKQLFSLGKKQQN